jgi:hypothetical protein
VGFVTAAVLPAIRRIAAPAERLALFGGIARRLAWPARATTLSAGLSGLYMLARRDLWDRFLPSGFWWVHAKVTLGLIFNRDAVRR